MPSGSAADAVRCVGCRVVGGHDEHAVRGQALAFERVAGQARVEPAIQRDHAEPDSASRGRMVKAMSADRS